MFYFGKDFAIYKAKQIMNAELGAKPVLDVRITL